MLDMMKKKRYNKMYDCKNTTGLPERRSGQTKGRLNMKQSKKRTANSLLRAAYVLSGLIVLGALILLLVSVVTAYGADTNADRLPPAPDYALSKVTVWDGEGIPDADVYLTGQTRPYVSAIRYLLPPANTVGDQDIALLMQLSDGTTRTENAVLSIQKAVMYYELGTTPAVSDLLGEEYADAVLSQPVSSFTELGSYPVDVTFGDKTLPFTMVVQDTSAPVVALKETLNFYLNQHLKPEDFVETCLDVSPVEYHFSEQPVTAVEGSYPIQIIATDDAGNSRTLDAVYNISGDGEPPVFQGLEKMRTIAGIPIDYLHGVKAIDGKDGEVEVRAEEPADFSIRTAGTYKIKFTSTDKAGNTATESVELEVLPNLDQVKELSEDDVLRMGDYIVKSLEDGTEKTDQRAFLKKLYYQVQNHMVYVDNKDILDWQYAAVVAIYRGYGDCRNYYAYARLLLTCAGFENMMVEHEKQNEWSNAHYWNLVKVNGAWYHFDTTPRIKRFEFFLMTDAELDAYSATDGNCFERDRSLYPSTPA
ncbi:MAG TPA: hypothetical protein DDX71_05700 [Ruminococcus sp.]|nr:hypothetical protein [Ruminococcus sp.]